MTLHPDAYREYLKPGAPTSKRDDAPYPLAPTEERARLHRRIGKAFTRFRKSNYRDPHRVILPRRLLAALGYPTHLYGRPVETADRALVLDREGDEAALTPTTTFRMTEVIRPRVWRGRNREPWLRYMRAKWRRRAHEEGFAPLEEPTATYTPPADRRPLADSRLNHYGRVRFEGRAARRIDAQATDEE